MSSLAFIKYTLTTYARQAADPIYLSTSKLQPQHSSVCSTHLLSTSLPTKLQHQSSVERSLAQLVLSFETSRIPP